MNGDEHILDSSFDVDVTHWRCPIMSCLAHCSVTPAYDSSNAPSGTNTILPITLPLSDQLKRLSCLSKRKAMCDERLALLLPEEVNQGAQVLWLIRGKAVNSGPQ